MSIYSVEAIQRLGHPMVVDILKYDGCLSFIKLLRRYLLDIWNAIIVIYMA